MSVAPPGGEPPCAVLSSYVVGNSVQAVLYDIYNIGLTSASNLHSTCDFRDRLCSLDPIALPDGGLFTQSYTLMKGRDQICKISDAVYSLNLCQVPECTYCITNFMAQYCLYPGLWWLFALIAAASAYIFYKALYALGWAILPYALALGNRGAKAAAAIPLAALAIMTLPGVMASCTGTVPSFISTPDSFSVSEGYTRIESTTGFDCVAITDTGAVFIICQNAKEIQFDADELYRFAFDHNWAYTLDQPIWDTSPRITQTQLAVGGRPMCNMTARTLCSRVPAGDCRNNELGIGAGISATPRDFGYMYKLRERPGKIETCYTLMSDFPVGDVYAFGTLNEGHNIINFTSNRATFVHTVDVTTGGKFDIDAIDEQTVMLDSTEHLDVVRDLYIGNFPEAVEHMLYVDGSHCNPCDRRSMTDSVWLMHPAEYAAHRVVWSYLLTRVPTSPTSFLNRIGFADSAYYNTRTALASLYPQPRDPGLAPVYSHFLARLVLLTNAYKNLMIRVGGNSDWRWDAQIVRAVFDSSGARGLTQCNSGSRSVPSGCVSFAPCSEVTCTTFGTPAENTDPNYFEYQDMTSLNTRANQVAWEYSNAVNNNCHAADTVPYAGTLPPQLLQAMQDYIGNNEPRAIPVAVTDSWLRTPIEATSVTFNHVEDCVVDFPDYRWSIGVANWGCPLTVLSEGCIPPQSDGCKFGRDITGRWFSDMARLDGAVKLSQYLTGVSFSTNYEMGALSSISTIPVSHPTAFYTVSGSVTSLSTPIAIVTDVTYVYTYGMSGEQFPFVIEINVTFVPLNKEQVVSFKAPHTPCTGMPPCQYSDISVGVSANQRFVLTNMTALSGYTSGDITITAQAPPLVDEMMYTVHFVVAAYDDEPQRTDQIEEHDESVQDCILGVCEFNIGLGLALGGFGVTLIILVVVVAVLCCRRPKLRSD